MALQPTMLSKLVLIKGDKFDENDGIAPIWCYSITTCQSAYLTNAPRFREAYINLINWCHIGRPHASCSSQCQIPGHFADKVILLRRSKPQHVLRHYIRQYFWAFSAFSII
ncbi:hypothetical protein AB6A40_004525 [Gnathostoma spinigerum]|uniref:Uncharacterized protein n=1 Tax=Gnathostoma spinigerum TaxID=75299 RepID=A0ABD6EK67_9BILA